MALRFWRRVKLAPGVTLNLSKSGGSLSLGPRGAKQTLSPRGRRTTVGLPGTGLFYTTTHKSGSGGKKSRRASPPPMPEVPENDRLDMGFFRRLVTPKQDEHLVDGCRELSRGREAKSLDYFRRAGSADGAFLAGLMCINLDRPDEAVQWLDQAAAEHGQLGTRLLKMGIELSLSLPLTEQFAVHVGPSRRGALLALVEACQRNEDWQKAFNTVQILRREDPEDAVILLSMVELLWAGNENDEDTCRFLLKEIGTPANETAVHSELRLYRARALNGLGLHTAARDVLTETLRRKKNRPDELMLALRYERALTYRRLGHHGRSRKDLERIYAADPEFGDVASRLNVSGG